MLGPPVEVQVIEPDAEQQLEPAADFLEHLASGVRAGAFRLHLVQKGVQLVEVQLADLVNGPAADLEQQPRRRKPRPLTIGTGVLHHDLVEPRLHPRVRFAALPVAAVVALDPARDAAESDLPAFVAGTLDLRVGRGDEGDLARFDAVENGGPGALGKILPGHVEPEAERGGEAEHHPAIPRVRVVLERLAHEAAARDAAVRVRNQELGMRQLVDPEPAAGAARALRLVEDEECRADVTVDEVPCRTAERAVKPLGGLPVGAACHVHLHQAVADEQRAGDARADRLFVLAADDEAIDDDVDVADVRRLERDLLRQVVRRPVDDQTAAAFLAQLGEHEVELLAVDLEHRRPQLDLRALGQRQDRFQDLTRRSNRYGLAGPRTARCANRREQEVQVTGDVGHRADGRARIAGNGLLLDRDHGRQAEHEVDVGLGDLGDEASGKGRERLHVAALPLGVDGVERQARLP